MKNSGAEHFLTSWFNGNGHATQKSEISLLATDWIISETNRAIWLKFFLGHGHICITSQKKN
jgi:hypothetical protein